MLSAALLVLAMAPGAYDPIFHNGFSPLSECPDGRQTLADIAYVGDDSQLNRYDVDVTEWANIWGHATALDDMVPWPGRPNSAPIILNFGLQTYIAAHYLVPAGTPLSWFGWIVHTEYLYSTDITGAISTACGDFSPSAQACFIAAISGQNLVPWRANAGNFCPLQGGTNYYLNLMATNPEVVGPNCDAGQLTCPIGTANAFSAP